VECQERVWYELAGAATAEASPCRTVLLKVCTGTA